MLEIIDLSHNKIKRFPPQLGTSLRVTHSPFPPPLWGWFLTLLSPLSFSPLSPLCQILSLANNAVTVVSSCILDAPSLEVLHIEGNPIVFPPKDVAKKMRGGTDQEFLVELKDWLRENDSSLTLSRRKIMGTKEPQKTGDTSKSLALRQNMSEQDELKDLLKMKKEEERLLKDGSNQRRRHSSSNPTPPMIPQLC